MSQPRRKRRRRCFQLSLRTLLAVMTLAASLGGAWRWYLESYRAQERAIAAIERAGGHVQTTVTVPRWVCRAYNEESLQNVVLVNVADCDDPAAYVDQVASLPRIETLVVDGKRFTDGPLRRLHRLVSLRGLVLDTTSISDDALAALTKVLPRLEVYRSQRRAIAALERAGDLHRQQNAAHSRLRELVGKEWFAEATSIDFSHARNNDAALAPALPLLKFLSQVRSIDLSATRVKNADLVHLSGLNRLRQLYLNDTQVSDAACRIWRYYPSCACWCFRARKLPTPPEAV
jgi:hypothetical protein